MSKTYTFPLRYGYTLDLSEAGEGDPSVHLALVKDGVSGFVISLFMDTDLALSLASELRWQALTARGELPEPEPEQYNGNYRAALERGELDPVLDELPDDGERAAELAEWAEPVTVGRDGYKSVAHKLLEGLR